MNNNKTLVAVSLPKKDKEEFYKLCKILEIKPMRVILILIKRFIEGSIEATPVIEEYKDYYAKDIGVRTIRLLENRIDGKEAHRLHKEKQDANI